ncbi:MAG TPA: YdcF family protein [Pseudolabrys sp.]|jgi:uncharacterized SAM-binding protein YcdF (DUF218 family)|nr:YdcF family protein [Pseudolabrys sp.]
MKLRRLVRRIGFPIITLGGILAVLLVAGFFWFVHQIPREEVHLDRTADGIVVLTGAAARIPDAIELLAESRGQRLLITGVHPTTRSREIAKLTPLYAQYFSCCIDLDRTALNTFGNAVQARRWAHQHHFKSLIVVTSNWHMPRAMVEIKYELPDATLIPFPVMSETVKTKAWWESVATARRLIAEYVKYLMACAHLHLDPDLAG